MKTGMMRSAARRSLRGLKRSPSFTLGAVITLGISVGSLGSVFTMVDQALLDPLPYPEADRLVLLTETTRGERISTAYLNYLDWRESARTIEQMGLYVGRGITVTGDGPAELILGIQASSSLFDVLGVEPALGRTLAAEADREGGPLEVLLTHDFWATRYGSDPGIVGRSIILNDRSHEVVGVMPEGFAFPAGIIFGSGDMFVPIGSEISSWQDRGSHPGISVLGRVADGVTLDAARREMEGIAARLASIHPENRDEGISFTTAREEILGDLPDGLRLLAIAGGLVLLIGLANALSLSTARAITRRDDLAVSRALGASRGDLVGEAVVEGLLFGVLAAALALGSAKGLLLIFREDLAELPRLRELELGWTPVIFMLAVSLVGSVAIQLGALAGSMRRRGDVGRASRGVGRPAMGGRGWRAGLVGGQVALAVLLACGSGILIQSLAALNANAGGVDPAGVLTFRMNLPEDGYEGEGRTEVFYGQLLESIGAMRGVVAAGGISTLPFSGSGAQTRFQPEGVEMEEGLRTDVNVVFEDYFEAMGVELIAGRTFLPTDDAASAPVVVVDERFANRFWPGGEAIGQRVSGWGLENASVVGVVRHVKNYGVASDSREELYMPHRQRPYRDMYVIVRSELAPTALVEPIRQAVSELDPNVPITSVRDMETVVARTVSTERIAARLGWALAAIAVFLAFFGAYALIAHSVSQRTREMGLRMALGQQRGSVRRMVLTQGIAVTGSGVVVGLVTALAAADVLSGIVFGVSTRAPEVYAAAAGLVFLMSVLATWVPAERAASTDPMGALRAD